MRLTHGNAINLAVICMRVILIKDLKSSRSGAANDRLEIAVVSGSVEMVCEDIHHRDNLVNERIVRLRNKIGSVVECLSGVMRKSQDDSLYPQLYVRPTIRRAGQE